MNMALFYLELIVFTVLVALSAFFSAGETSLTSLSKFDIKAMIHKIPAKAEPLRAWLEKPNRLLTAILFGDTFVNISASIIATLMAIHIAESLHIRESVIVGFTTGIVTICLLVFGEIIPKTFAKRNRKKLSLILINPLLLFTGMISPVTKVLVGIANLFMRIFGKKAPSELSIFTQDEIRTIIDISEKEGIIKKEEKKMLNDVLAFNDTIVRDIMVPRNDMHCIAVSTKTEEVINKAIGCGHSRLPVYRGSIDDVIGVLYVKDILKALSKNELLSVETLMRRCIFVQETEKIDSLLKEFRKGGGHIAVVSGRNGRTSGLVTIEDLLEQITGEIRDEYDVARNDIKELDDGSLVVSAREGLDRIGNALGVRLPSESFDSIGSLTTDLFGRVPKKGEKIKLGSLTFIIEDASRKRVIKVKIIKNAAERKDDFNAQSAGQGN